MMKAMQLTHLCVKINFVSFLEVSRLFMLNVAREYKYASLKKYA